MLTADQARHVGIDACIEKIGREFVRDNADRVASVYGEHEGFVYCFVGISKELKRCLESTTPNMLRLTSDNSPLYRASCDVAIKDGSITFIETVVPKSEKI